MAGPIEAKTCDLAVTSPLANKGAVVTVKAGGELTFKLAPRDRFGNDASAAADAAPATFSWQLVMTKAARTLTPALALPRTLTLTLAPTLTLTLTLPLTPTPNPNPNPNPNPTPNTNPNPNPHPTPTPNTRS